MRAYSDAAARSMTRAKRLIRRRRGHLSDADIALLDGMVEGLAIGERCWLEDTIAHEIERAVTLRMFGGEKPMMMVDPPSDFAPATEWRGFRESMAAQLQADPANISARGWLVIADRKLRRGEIEATPADGRLSSLTRKCLNGPVAPIWGGRAQPPTRTLP